MLEGNSLQVKVLKDHNTVKDHITINICVCTVHENIRLMMSRNSKDISLMDVCIICWYKLLTNKLLHTVTAKQAPLPGQLFLPWTGQFWKSCFSVKSCSLVPFPLYKLSLSFSWAELRCWKTIITWTCVWIEESVLFHEALGTQVADVEWLGPLQHSSKYRYIWSPRAFLSSFSSTTYNELFIDAK